MRVIILCIMLAAAKLGAAQFTVGFHQSNLPFFAFGYEGKSRFVPELRIGVDQYFSDLAVEGVVLYKLLRQDELDLYAGLGGRSSDFSGLVIPLGANIYPFNKKTFGFDLELAPIIVFEGSSLLRGSGGLRYRFGK